MSRRRLRRTHFPYTTLFRSISIAADRDTGALRRLRGTPATASSYFIGKIMLVAIVSLAEAVILLLVAVFVFGLRLPSDSYGRSEEHTSELQSQFHFVCRLLL